MPLFHWMHSKLSVNLVTHSIDVWTSLVMSKWASRNIKLFGLAATDFTSSIGRLQIAHDTLQNSVIVRTLYILSGARAWAYKSRKKYQLLLPFSSQHGIIYKGPSLHLSKIRNRENASCKQFCLLYSQFLPEFSKIMLQLRVFGTSIFLDNR